jgi:site-specific DNA-methyltransferase (cytosine-N4-specific)
MHAARLIYSRWQVQCKVGAITLDAVAKEVGMCEVTLANVILIVSTKKATDSALTYRSKIVSTSNLNIIFVDGPLLDRVIKDNSTLLGILHQQAEDALNLKKTSFIKGAPPSGSGSSSVEVQSEKPKAKPIAGPMYETPQGQLFNADALDVLPALITQGVRGKLIVTSPPFPLVRKKEYGNEDSDSYVAWFEKFIPYFKRILEPGGSLVIDLGGVWIKGIPAKSTYQYKLLLKLCESGYYLAQEFYHYNPARLPTPAEWVTVRRMRVKDAINNVWWLTLDPFAPVSNRGVLQPYSNAMKTLLKNGYKPALRPSGHDISDKFQRDNGGAIPPNLLTLANTDSSGYYLRRCKEEGMKPHPARFPQGLADFFIKFLTKPGDLVIDPFAGSNVTGISAESLGRKWISIELDSNYAHASRFRFEDKASHVPVEPRNTTSKARVERAREMDLFA